MSLVETTWVENNLSNIKLIDCSWHLPNASRNPYQEYLNHHLPNALFFDLDKILIRIQNYHICCRLVKSGMKLFQV